MQWPWTRRWRHGRGDLLAEVARLNDALNEARANIAEMREQHDGAIVQLKVEREMYKARHEEAEDDLAENQAFLNKIDIQIGEALVLAVRVAAAESRNEADGLRRENVALKGHLRTGKEALMAEWQRAEGLAKRVADLEDALAVEQAEAVRQFGIADEAQDRATNLEVELTLAVDAVRKLRDACYLTRLAVRETPTRCKCDRPEIDACTAAITIADRFLAPHAIPENAQPCPP